MLCPIGGSRIPVVNAVRQLRMFRSGCAILAAFLILSACTREEATTRLKDNLPVEELRIIHARFPCWSPDLHFFGYRFRVTLKGESGDGDIGTFQLDNGLGEFFRSTASRALTLANKIALRSSDGAATRYKPYGHFEK